MFSNHHIDNTGFFVAFYYFYLDATSEVKLKLSSLNLLSLFLALRRPCSINLIVHVLGIHHLGGKTSKKRPKTLPWCREKLLMIVIIEVNLQIKKAIT